MVLSPCAQHYALAISDPFHPDAKGVCVPKLPARMSEKAHGMLKFSVTAGTNGYAFLSVSPCLANNRPFAVHSTASFTGTSTIGTTLTTPGVSFSDMASLPHAIVSMTDATASGNPAVSGRIVSVGVSVQYSGQAQLRGGIMRAYTDPNHSNLFGQDFAQNTAPGVSNQAVTDREFKYAISAIDSDEWEYQNGETDPTELIAYPFSQGRALNNVDATAGGAPFFWDVTTTPGNTFFVKIIVHCEYIGRNSTGALTPSHADSSGFEKVAAASAKVNSLRASKPEADMSALFRTAFNDVLRELQPVAMSGVKGVANALARSYL